MSKKLKLALAYWVVTLPVIGMMGLSGSMYFMPTPEMIEGIKTTGYPLFFMHILGTAKILGAIAILTNLNKRLKEWAYAGFIFTMLGATATHYFIGDPLSKTAVPLVFLAVILLSYFLWNLRKNQEI